MADTPNPYQSPNTIALGDPSVPRKWRGWARTRQKGRRHFVWVYGTLAMGCSSLLITSLMIGLQDSSGHWPWFYLSGLVIYPVGGYVWGAIMWSLLEKQFKKDVAPASNS